MISKITFQEKDNTEKHNKQLLNRIRKIIDGCEVDRLADVDREEIEEFIANMTGDDGIGPRTVNHYMQAIDSFGRWLVSSMRLPSNPFSGLKRLNPRVAVRHKRRALKPDEFRQFIESARNSDVSIQCYDGETRARIYVISCLTGLRRSEIASLTPESFDLTSQPPTYTVEAEHSKHRRTDVVAVQPILAEILREWLKDYEPGEILFPKLAKRRTWRMVQKDLERVGIPYETDEGKADFHAIGRHSFITQLLRDGVSLMTVCGLARHADIRMTANYAHLNVEDQSRELSKVNCQHICRPRLSKRVFMCLEE